MGARKAISRMAWASNLGAMAAHGTRLRASCRARDCGFWSDLCPAALSNEYGPESDVRTLDLRCASCGTVVTIIGSPGEGTPFRALR